MAEHALIKAARGVIDAFNASDWEKGKAAFARDAVYDEVGTARRIEGGDAIMASWQAWKQAMPDVKGTVNGVVHDGHTVALEITWKGSHTGPLQTPGGTIPATGKPQTTRASLVMNFDGDKIKDSRHYFDMLSFLQQIGVIPR